MKMQMPSNKYLTTEYFRMVLREEFILELVCKAGKISQGESEVCLKKSSQNKKLKTKTNKQANKT